MSQVCIFFAPGLEEIEGLTVVDLMRRAGISIQIVSITDSLDVVGAHNISIKADSLLSETDFSDTDMLVLPGGGPGTCNLEACEPLKALLKDFYSHDKYVAAICAAPMILGHLGFLKDRNAACYPGFEKELIGAMPVTLPAVVDGHVITSRGLGTAIEFACTLISLLKDEAAADDIKNEIIYNRPNKTFKE